MSEESKTPRRGDWMDVMGACKVCGGEIPYGHLDECAYYKLETELEAARRIIGKLPEIEFASSGYCPACAGWENTKGQGCERGVHSKTCWLDAALRPSS